MKNSRLQFESPEEVETVFYEAFIHCDADMMAELWAEGDVVCIHPGSGIIVGYEAVVRSWRQIFSNALPPQINYTMARRFVSEHIAVSIVTEEISTDGGDTALVLATNVYQKFEHGWQMVEHHGSLAQSRPQTRTLQ